MQKPRIFLSPPHMGGHELTFVNEAFESNFIAPLGPQVDAFEKEFAEYTGIKHCLALSSGTAAMHLALRYLNINPGDEVFASTLTFIGSVTPIIFEGATPVFIDCSTESWNMDHSLLKAELERGQKAGRLPKAVVPTDLYGQCCDLQRIVDICNGYGVPVICDSAEALGAKYKSSDASEWKHAGRDARAAVFSFNGNKIITTSGGGMLASDDEEFITKARFWSQQARDPFPHYEHTEIGYNYRMSNIIAAVGRGQLEVIEDRVFRKREIFDFYRKNMADIPGIRFMPEPEGFLSTRWLTVMLVDPEKFGGTCEAIRLALEAENIESRPLWKPMHLQPVFSTSGLDNQGKKQYRARKVAGNISEQLFDQGLCLPSGSSLTTDDLGRIVDIIKSCQR